MKIIPFLLCHMFYNSILSYEYKMVVTWGKPLDVSPPTVLTGISWDDCIQKCWNDTSCVLIHDTSPTCDYYMIGQVATVEKLTWDSNIRVAFRVPKNSVECPLSDPEQEPILLDGTVPNEAFAANQTIPYTITLGSDVWKFSPRNFTLVCPRSSKQFTRGSTLVCMEVVQTTDCLIRSDAAAECGSFGNPNTLMGIASWDEFDYVRNISLSFLTAQKTSTIYTRIGVWLDGFRKASCQVPAVKSSSCNGENEFDFSDPYAQSPVFQWRPDQPDALIYQDADAECLFFRVSSLADDMAGVGDMSCYQPTNPSLEMCYGGYLCGSYPYYQPVF